MKAEWVEILPKTQLQAGTLDKGHNYFSIPSKQRWTHLRLHNYPDGGVITTIHSFYHPTLDPIS